MTEQVTESRLYSVNLPGEARANVQSGHQMVYTIGTEDRQTIASEQVDNLLQVGISSASLHREQVPHQAAVLQSHEMEERVMVGPTQLHPVAALPTRQLHMASFTPAVQESHGFTEQHSEYIQTPAIIELELTQEQKSKMMSAVVEEITPVATVKTELSDRKPELIQPTPEPKQVVTSHQVETRIPIMKEKLQMIPKPEVEKSYKVKEGIKILYSAISTREHEIAEAHSTELSSSDSALQSSLVKELSKPVHISTSETKQTLSKEQKFEIYKPKEEKAQMLKDKLVQSSLTSEEKQLLQSEHTEQIPGIESAISVQSQKEGERIMHLQVIREQNILPSEDRFTCEAPVAEQADTRKSPILIQTTTIDEQKSVTCEEMLQFSSQDDKFSIQPTKEAPVSLHLQSVHLESYLPKEGIFTVEKPNQQVAVQRLEKVRRQAVNTEEKRELTADYCTDLDVSVTGVYPEQGTEPKPQTILQAVSEPMLLPKEIPFSTEVKEQRASKQKEDRWNVMHLMTTADSRTIEEGHTDSFKAVDKFSCETKVEPKVPAEPLHIEEKAISTESSVSLEAAEQDFAVQIQEGQSVRQSILVEEKKIITGEMSGEIIKSETTAASVTTQSKGAFLVHESQESKTLPKELTFVIQAPKSFGLDIRHQLENALQSAVAHEQPVLLAEVAECLQIFEVKEVKVHKEPKYAMFTYLITTSGAPIEITIAFDGEYPQTADLKNELGAAFYSVIHCEQQVLTSEQPGTMQIDRPQRIQVSSAPSKQMLSSTVETITFAENVVDFASHKEHSAAVKTESQASFKTVKAHDHTVIQESQEIFYKDSKTSQVMRMKESKSEFQEFKQMTRQEVKTVTVKGYERDVHAADITTDMPVVPIPVGHSQDVLIQKESREEFLKDVTKTKPPEKLTKDYPVIETFLEDITIEEHCKVTFSVTIRFVKRVNWLFNGKLVKSGKEFKCSKDHDTYTLVIEKVIKEKHQGEYICEAVNEAGKTSTSSKLTVVLRVPPVFRHKVQPLEINLGSRAKFECEIEDAPNVKFKWYKSGTEIRESEKCRIISRYNTTSMELLNPTKADSGQYTCKATNQHGSDSCSASLTVTEVFPPVFVTKPDPMTLYVGKQARIQCVLSGSSPMNVVWQKGNIPISKDANYKITSEKNRHTLEIVKLSLTDHGEYHCRASNSVGTDMCSTELRVIDKPNFVKTFESVSVAVGNPLRLECQVDEDTGVTISWTRDGKKMHNTMDHKLSFEDKLAILEITNTNLKDTGKYVCTATNDAGSSSCSSMVSVQEPPTFVKRLEPKILWKHGVTARMQCTVKGSPELHITWFMNGRELITGEKHKISFKDGQTVLEINGVSVADSGNYTCEVLNEAGCESMMLSFLLLEPPSFRRELKMVEVVRGT
ncbi:hypothetical protein ANANG_G00063830, partial [Anguilla anguilla]